MKVILSQVATFPFPLITTEQGPLLQPVAILQRHTILRDDYPIQQVLKQYEGLSVNDNSWEDVEQLHILFQT